MNLKRLKRRPRHSWESRDPWYKTREDGSFVRQVAWQIEHGLLWYANIYFGTAESLRDANPRPSYVKVISQTEDEIVFEPLTKKLFERILCFARSLGGSKPCPTTH